MWKIIWLSVIDLCIPDGANLGRVEGECGLSRVERVERVEGEVERVKRFSINKDKSTRFYTIYTVKKDSPKIYTFLHDLHG